MNSYRETVPVLISCTLTYVAIVAARIDRRVAWAAAGNRLPGGIAGVVGRAWYAICVRMAIHVALHHKTKYRYDRPVYLGPQVIRLRPAPHCRTPIHSYSLKVLPENRVLHWQQDAQANYQARVVFPEATGEFAMDVELTAEMVPINPFDFFLEPESATYPFHYDTETARELCPYVEADAAGPNLASFLAEIPRKSNGTMNFLVDLNRRLRGEIGYVRRPEPGIRTCEETLALRQGSCRDSAWLLVQIARHLGLASRFVSGYLVDLGAIDSADLHAWAEVYLPGAGWVGFDPTSGVLAAEGHIPLACTPQAGRAAPISGMHSVGNTEFHHEMSVTRLLPE
jgi:transglutaminase-like putative cysteine protease